MNKINLSIAIFKTNRAEKKLNRLNKKLYEMMLDKQPTQKLISFENRVIKAREKLSILKEHENKVS